MSPDPSPVDAHTDTLRVLHPPAPPRLVHSSSPRRIRPAWAVLVCGDLIGLLLPAALAPHGRTELLAMAALTLVLFQSGGLYRPQLKLSALDDAPKLVSRSVAAMLLVGGITAVIGYAPVLNAYFVMASLAVFLQLVCRSLTYTAIRRARGAGKVSHNTLVIGGGEVAGRILARLVTDKTYGLEPVGFHDLRPSSPQAVASAPFCGPARLLPQNIIDTKARVLIVAFGDEPESELVKVLRASERSGCDVFVVPRLFELHNYGQTDHIGAVPVVRLPRRGLRTSSRLLKRAIDIVISAVALVLCSPVLVTAAVAVRVEGGKGVIFRQTRVGRGGRHFDLLKFRSLKPLDETEAATLWDASTEVRMGRVGRILRQTSIDELPQLVNILKGDMTLVGPRPERPHFVQTFADEIPEYSDRHRMPVGLTGLAQVSGLRGDTSISDRARYDNFYIDNWTLWMDVKIMCGTLREVVGARGR